MKMKIIEYLVQNGISAEQTNEYEWCSACMICGGKNCFSFWSDRQRYYCSNCKQSGNLIDLIRKVEAVDFDEACLKACFEAELAKNDSVLLQYRSNFINSSENPDEAWQNQADKLIEKTHEQLINAPELLACLKNNQGLSLATVKNYKLGWNENESFSLMSEWGLKDPLRDNGKQNTIWLPRGLVIPSFSANRRAIRIKIERPVSDLKNENDFKTVLLPGGSLDVAFWGKEMPNVVVVESELEAILLQQHCGDIANSVSTVGVFGSISSKSHEKLVSAKKIIISFSNNRASRASTLSWLDAFTNARFWPIIRNFGKNCCEAYRNGLDLRSWLEIGIDASSLRDENQIKQQKNSQSCH